MPKWSISSLWYNVHQFGEALHWLFQRTQWQSSQLLLLPRERQHSKPWKGSKEENALLRRAAQYGMLFSNRRITLSQNTVYMMFAKSKCAWLTELSVTKCKQVWVGLPALGSAFISLRRNLQPLFGVCSADGAGRGGAVLMMGCSWCANASCVSICAPGSHWKSSGCIRYL